MTRWEYKADVFFTIDGLAKDATKLGAEGWRLVRFIHCGALYHAMFERPLKEPADG